MVSNRGAKKRFLQMKKKAKKCRIFGNLETLQYPSYPTEKNLELLKFIIQSSSNQGDLILDCFCGSGTTLIAAQELERNWIGIDKSDLAVKVTKKDWRTYRQVYSHGLNMRC